MSKNQNFVCPNKTIMRLKWLLNILLILASYSITAQSESEKGLPFITNYLAKTYQALPQTWCIQEGESGIMYFGIQSYVLEYDGLKWRKITVGNSPSTVVRAMPKDKNGVIYYGAYGDLGYLGKDSLGQMKTISLLDDIPKANRNFLDIWSAYAADDGIYFQSREYIFKISNNNATERRSVKVWKPQTKFMYSFYVDGNYYVHQQGLGLYKMINDSLVLVPGSEFLGKERMQVMLPYPPGPNNEKQYLIGMFYSGLYIYNGKTFRPFSTKADVVFKSGTLLYKGLQLKNGDYVLLTTGKGFVIIDVAGNLIEKINRDVGLQDESIYNSFVDSRGALWLALDNGISRVEISSPLTKFTLQSGIGTGVLTMRRFDGNIYLGTTNGLLKYDSAKKFFNPVPGIPQNQIFTILRDGDELLVAGDGLFAIKDKKVTTIRPSVSGDLTLSGLYIPRKNRDLLIGGGPFGAVVFTRKNGNQPGTEPTPWHFGGNIPGVTEQIWSFSENSSGKIWAGSANGIVYRITPVIDNAGNLDKAKTLVETFSAKQGLKDAVGTVTTIKGKSYFNADTLLYTFDDKQNRFVPDYTFGKFPKGSSASQFAIEEDSSGRVWIRVGRETLLATPKPEGSYTLDYSQLKPVAEFTVQDFYPEKTGILWLCTTDGLIRYDENLEKDFDESFQTVLRHIEAGKRSISVDLTSNQKPVSIYYKNNTLRFEYAAPFFEQEEKTQYQTWLEGFEKGWSDFDNNYYKEYTNLPSGEYHFHVRAKNVYDKLSKEAVFSFTINPPWYFTWWAYVLYALAAFLIIYLFISWRIRKLKEQHAELEKTVEERTSQLSQRVAELAVINSVQEALVREMDMQGIYNLVGDRVQKLFKAQVVIIASFDLDNKMEHFNYAFEKGEMYKQESRPINKLRQLLIDKKHTIYIDTEKKASKEYGITAIGDTEMPKSLLFVPLLTGNIIKGYVSLQNIDTENAFSESDIRLLETLSNSMSVALENARLFDETTRLLKETEQRTAELSVINSVQEGLAKELHMQGIYELVGDKLSEVMHTLDIDIRLFSPETNQVSYPYMRDRGEKIDVSPTTLRGMSKHVYETQQTLIINENLAGRMEEFGSTPIPGTQMEKSFMAVPIMAGNKALGMVSMSNYETENAFSDSDVRLLQTVVSAMSVALENARLFDETTRLLKETEQRTAELAVINSVQEGLVREMNTQSIFEMVGDRICSLFPETQTMVIRTFDRETGLEYWQYAIEKGVKLKNDPQPLIWANKQLLVTKKPLLINENYLETAKKFGGSGVSKGQPPRSAIFVPMIVGEEVKGSLSLQNVDKEHAFSEADVRLLATVTNSMSVAVENARLFDETAHLLAQTKQRASELSTVNNISKALASKLDAHDLINLVGDQLKELFKANIVYLALLNKQTNIINFPYQYGDNMPSMKLGKGLTSNIILTGEPLLINKGVDEQTGQLGLQRIGIPAASYLGVPIPVGDEMIGVLSVQSTEQENRFNENDLRLLTTIASSVGVALKNAQLFEDVQQAKMEAEQASKIAEKANEAKSAFLSTVSHELRTPLTSVLGFAKIIKKRLEEKIFPMLDKTDSKTGKTVDQVSENLNVVISEGERLTHLINDVLDLAKIEAGKMEWNQENVSLTEVIERAAAATTSLFDQKDIKLIKHIDNDVPTIIGDTDKLIQVVINLFSNAVKFTDAGSVTCTSSHNNNEVIVSITDTGIGIAKEDFGAVFEQFKQVGGDTLTDKPKGTGLGLPICKEIIEHHGGRIWLESEVGKGSKFSFALPLVPTGRKTQDTPIHLNELMKQLKEQMVFSRIKTDGKNATILVVDDDDSIRSLLHQELSDAGYIIEEARDGKMALESIRKNRPDLIILDVMMPEINGFDVAAILKNDPQTMDIPIIILSIVQDKARGFRIGVDRYLTKPIDTVQLFEEVGNLLEQGKSKKKVMVVDEDTSAVRSLTEVLQAKGYIVVESDGKELVEKAISTQPDIIILNSVVSDKNEIVQSLRFEKGLENVLFLIYQ